MAGWVSESEREQAGERVREGVTECDMGIVNLVHAVHCSGLWEVRDGVNLHKVAPKACPIKQKRHVEPQC